MNVGWGLRRGAPDTRDVTKRAEKAFPYTYLHSERHGELFMRVDSGCSTGSSFFTSSLHGALQNISTILPLLKSVNAAMNSAFQLTQQPERAFLSGN